MNYTPVVSMGNCRITIRETETWFEISMNSDFSAIVPFHPKSVNDIQYCICFPDDYKDTFKSYKVEEISKFQKLIKVTEIFTKGLIENDLG